MIISIVIFGVFMAFGLALIWLSPGPPDWYAPRGPEPHQALLRCTHCRRTTTPLEAERHVFNAGACGNCGGRLEEI